MLTEFETVARFVLFYNAHALPLWRTLTKQINKRTTRFLPDKIGNSYTYYYSIA